MTEDLENLNAGTYSVTITDVNGCTTTATAEITQPDSPVSATESHVNILCYGELSGSIVTVSGGTAPYTYLWSNGATTEDILDISAGSYSVTITDSQGCANTMTVTITQPEEITASTVITNVSCFGLSDGAVVITPAGGTAPYTITPADRLAWLPVTIHSWLLMPMAVPSRSP